MFGVGLYFLDLESVQARPILTQAPANVTVPIGSNVNFTCVVLSQTHRHLEWYHGYHTFFDTLNKTNDSSRVEVKVGLQLLLLFYIYC